MSPSNERLHAIQEEEEGLKFCSYVLKHLEQKAH